MEEEVKGEEEGVDGEEKNDGSYEEGSLLPVHCGRRD